MRSLSEDIARHLSAQIRARRIVVWYDVRSEFAPFVDELRGTVADRATPVLVSLDGVQTTLVSTQAPCSSFEPPSNPF